MACRSAKKANEAIQQLAEEQPGNKAIFHELDLANLEAVRKSAAEFLKFVILVYFLGITTLTFGFVEESPYWTC